MDSKPSVRLSATQATPVPAQACNKSSSSFSGSLPIRAPLTPDSDSEFEFNGNELGYISSGNASFGCESGSESEAFVTGDEYETASERPLVADRDEEFSKQSVSVEKYELSWPFLADPDEFKPVVMPVAHLSWESDENDVVGSEEVLSDVEDDEFLAMVQVCGNGFVGKLSVAPRIKVFEVEEEEEEEDEPVKWKESVVVRQSEPDAEAKSVEGSDLNNFGNVQAEWIEDNGLAIAETNEANSAELSIDVLEGGEKAKYVGEEPFVHCVNRKRNGVDLGLEENENQIVDSATDSQPNPIEEKNCDLSELTKGNPLKNALCTDFLKSNAFSSDSATLFGENVDCELEIEDQVANGKHLGLEKNAGAVQFKGDAAYGAKVELPLEEKGFPMEQEESSLGLFGEMISMTPGVMVLEEGEENGSVLEKESLVGQQSEPAMNVKCVEGSDSNNCVKGQKGDSIRAEWFEDNGLEWFEDNGLAAEEINKPSSMELNINACEGGKRPKYVAEESIVHCSNRNRDGADACGSFEALERGMHSGTDFGVEGHEKQIIDSATYSQLYPVKENMGNGDLPEATKHDRYEYAMCSDFLKLITPSSNVTHKHIFSGETKVKNFNINGTTAGITITLSHENVVTGVKTEDEMTIGKRLVLAGSSGALQFEGGTAHGVKFEVRLKNKDFPTRQDRTSLGLSLMKWGGGLVLTADILSMFSVGSSKMAVHVVLDNKQRGQIAIRASNADKFQSALVGILSIAVSIFGIFSPRFGVRNSTQ